MANEKENCSECEGIGRKTRKTDTLIDEVLECKSCGGEGKVPLKMTNCPNCNGTGEKLVARGNHATIFKMRKCYTCIGTGTVTQETAKRFLREN